MKIGIVLCGCLVLFMAVGLRSDLHAQQVVQRWIPQILKPADTEVVGSIRLIANDDHWTLIDETEEDRSYEVESFATRLGHWVILLTQNEQRDSVVVFCLDAAAGKYVLQRSYHVQGVPEMFFEEPVAKRNQVSGAGWLGAYWDNGAARIREGYAWQALVIMATQWTDSIDVTFVGKVLRNDPSCFLSVRGCVNGDHITLPLVGENHGSFLTIRQSTSAEGSHLEVNVDGPNPHAGNYYCMGGGSIVGQYWPSQYVTEQLQSLPQPLAPEFDRFVSRFPLLTLPTTIADSSISNRKRGVSISKQDARRWICNVAGSDWHCVQATGDLGMDYNMEDNYFVYGRLPMANGEQVLLYGLDYEQCREFFGRVIRQMASFFFG